MCGVRCSLLGLPNTSAGGTQGLRIDFGIVKHAEEVIRIECTGHTFALGSTLDRLVLSKQTHSQTAHSSQVRCAVPILLATRVLSEGDVEHPMLSVLNTPVFTDGAGQPFRPRRWRRPER